jgi:hypothetical protein
MPTHPSTHLKHQKEVGHLVLTIGSPGHCFLSSIPMNSQGFEAFEADLGDQSSGTHSHIATSIPIRHSPVMGAFVTCMSSSSWLAMMGRKRREGEVAGGRGMVCIPTPLNAFYTQHSLEFRL